MFGLKIIRKKKYDSILSENKSLSLMGSCLSTEKDNLKQELTAMEIKLNEARKFNAEKAIEGGCLVGPWCENCIHKRYIGEKNMYPVTNYVGESRMVFFSKDIYCAKHIHDICPEWTCEKE